MTPSPVHMDEKYWCQPQKSLWFRKNEPFSNYTPDVTCPNCLKVVDGSVGDDVVHMVQDQILSTGVVPPDLPAFFGPVITGEQRR